MIDSYYSFFIIRNGYAILTFDSPEGKRTTIQSLLPALRPPLFSLQTQIVGIQLGKPTKHSQLMSGYVHMLESVKGIGMYSINVSLATNKTWVEKQFGSGTMPWILKNAYTTRKLPMLY